MRAITSIGEVGITAGNRQFLFRPSFQAMAQLDNPVESYALLFQPEYSGENENMRKRVERSRFIAATNVMQACCEDDIGILIGYTGNTIHTWRMGLMPFKDCVHIARSLITHGLIGKVEKEDYEDKGEYSDKFQPEKFVSVAVAHLGMSEREAWNLTMTGFILAMRAKFPNEKTKSLPSIKEHDANMAWLEKVNKLRDKK